MPAPGDMLHWTSLILSFQFIHRANLPVTFSSAFVTGGYSSAILFLTLLPTLESRRGLPRCTALNSAFLPLCGRIPSSSSRSDANIQVLLCVFSALVVFLLLTATGTVLRVLPAQLKRHHFAEGQKNSCIFLQVPGLQFLLEGAGGAFFSQSHFLKQHTPGSGWHPAGTAARCWALWAMTPPGRG